MLNRSPLGGAAYFIAGLLLAVISEPMAAQSSEPLHGLFDEVWEFNLREDPLLATSVGRHEYNDRLPSVSVADQERRAQARRSFLERLVAIERDGLERTDRVSYDMMERHLRDAISEFEFRTFESPLTSDWGFHMAFARLPSVMPLVTAGDYENYIARLDAFPEYVAQHITIMRAGLRRGFTMPQIVLEGYDATVSAHVVDEVRASIFWAPLETLPSSVPGTSHDRLREAGRRAIMDGAVPAYRAFLAFLNDEYTPGARTTLAASETPYGDDYYAYLISHFTTLDHSAQDIHELGLSEVARIRVEMDAIIEEVEFDGTFAEFLTFLRTDPQFYASTPEDLLKEASYIAKQADGKLPSLFGALPKLPYSVAPVPDDIAPKFTTGRYVSAPAGGTQPGIYWVNTYELSSRPLYALPALTLHEAVPGHHVQIALANELENLPDFRRSEYIEAFGEGWGLYSEWLGIEAGMYATPFDRFGRLTYEMWRACRLVIDTGIHAFGWTREQAIDYLASNTALSLHEVTTEIDRYISWPGQALAYKMGELTIRSLRQEAEEALGSRFDVRAFHDVVLGNGTVPLPVLEEQVRAYIREAAAVTPS